MEEKIKELKRDIINGYTYEALEIESHNANGILYRNENLILENGKIIYSCYEHHENGSEYEGANLIYYNVNEFLKTKIKDIITTINSAYYYNVMGVEE